MLHSGLANVQGLLFIRQGIPKFLAKINSVFVSKITQDLI